MDFAYSPKVQQLRERLTAFMEEHVYPAESVFEQQVAEGDRWQPTAIMETLKAEGKGCGTCSCRNRNTAPVFPTWNTLRWPRSWAAR
jgi:hypothetical protein